MLIFVSKNFEKQVTKINEKKILIAVSTVIENCEKAENVKEIQSIKDMKGYKNYFRIRIGDYRVGVKIENNKIFFLAIASRKEIYRIFP